MSTFEIVEDRIRSLIDLANATTGNTDTNLTDGVNALIGGYGQGGGSLEGLENGYDVMFYDENNEGLAFYSIKEGHTINPPVYNCKAWQTQDGASITFPYTPSADVILYANNDTLASQLYKFYNVDSAIYPYVFVMYSTGSTNVLWIYFIEKLEINNDTYIQYKKRLEGSAVLSISDDKNAEILASYAMNKISQLTYAENSDSWNMNSTRYVASNFDIVSTSLLGEYRLDE